ncbi:MAG: glycoside hydrolase 100 family protein [Phycisphaerae bacterium]|jgi:hypothetical protein
MKKSLYAKIEQTKQAALEVLLHNAHGPFHGLPRTAGWGYPEPYTRDLMIAGLGILVSENKKLIEQYKRVLETLAKNQSTLGHVPSLVHDPEDRGASDTTPLFLIGVGLYRKATGQSDFLEEAVKKSLTWMQYQSPSNRVLIAQMPTTDWRDEQWVLGYGLYVNTLAYTYYRLLGLNSQADLMREYMTHFTIKGERQNRHVHEGLLLRHKPYYAMWAYKVYGSERFDLLGNSLAILSGIAPQTRARQLISWIERECRALVGSGQLTGQMPPNFFPYIKPTDPDWRPRYEKYNRPGEYHNGGIWPFICGFYVAALVAAGRYRLAERKLLALTELIKPYRAEKVEFGFNEWCSAYDQQPRGQDWQTWSAAMYLYAATCVERKSTPLLDYIRSTPVKK